MSKTGTPWTFRPFEMYAEAGWEIYDPNMAARVAVFYDRAEAEDYLAWRNRRQAKRQAKKGRIVAVARTIDWEGRC